MLRMFLLLLLINISTCIALANPGGSFLKTEERVVIFPTDSFSTNTPAARLQDIAGNIICVIACPAMGFSDHESLSVIYKKVPPPLQELQPEKNNKITLKTNRITKGDRRVIYTGKATVIKR